MAATASQQEGPEVGIQGRRVCFGGALDGLPMPDNPEMGQIHGHVTLADLQEGVNLPRFSPVCDKNSIFIIIIIVPE